MKSSKLIALLALLLCATASFAQTFLGSGNSADPFILKSTNEWEALAQQVAEGKSFQNQFFRLSADIDTKGIQVGTPEKPFCGVFGGNTPDITFEGDAEIDGTGIQPPSISLEGRVASSTSTGASSRASPRARACIYIMVRS